MEYRLLGRTGVRVSSLCLGTMNFGGETSEKESIRMIHKALDAGINFLDTANMYNRGESERVVGNALDGERRTKVILATKVHFPMSKDPNDGGNSRRHIMQSVEASLQRRACPGRVADERAIDDARVGWIARHARDQCRRLAAREDSPALPAIGAAPELGLLVGRCRTPLDGEQAGRVGWRGNQLGEVGRFAGASNIGDCRDHVILRHRTKRNIGTETLRLIPQNSKQFRATHAQIIPDRFEIAIPEKKLAPDTVFLNKKPCRIP